MPPASLDGLVKPRSIAIVGLETLPEDRAARLAGNLAAGGFAGPITVVGTGLESSRGWSVVATLAALPAAPDLAILLQPADALGPIVEALGQRGTRAILALGSGASEGCSGPLAPALRAAAARHGCRIVGPNALGLAVPAHGLHASLGTAAPRPGELAFVGQSSGIAAYLLEWAEPREIGFSLFAGLGDAADVDIADLLDHLAYDPRTRAILLQLETVRDAREFMSAARAAARLKPVIVLRTGRTAATAARARARRAVPTSERAVLDAAFERAGLLAAEHLGQLVAAARTLAAGIRPAGDRLVILTNGHGLGQLAADLLIERGGRLAALPAALVQDLAARLPAGWSGDNPVDLLDDADADRYAAALEAVLAHRVGDAVLVVHGPSAGADPARSAGRVAELAAQASRPVLTAWLGERSIAAARELFRARRLANFPGCESAVAGFLQLCAWSRSQRQLMETPPSSPSLFVRDRAAAAAILAAARAAGRQVLDRAASTALLAAYGIELADDELPRAAPDMLELALLLQPDPVFGPVLVLDPTRGPGDGQCQRAVGLPPLNRRLARSMIERAGIDPQFGSAYGAPETVLEPLELVICKLAQMAGELDGLAELALDPLLALPGRAFATRALVRLGPPEPPAAERLAIRPYPVELERAIRLMDGTTAWLRPIRPEDEAALRRFVAALTPEDVTSRFFSPLKELDHQLAARLTQLDYDREMALVLLERAPDGGEGPIMGVGRLMADPGRRSAEYALTVRSDLKGRGLGRLLLEQVLACARERGLEEVWGSVLAHNGPMLGLVRKLGFTLTRDPDDPEIIKTVWRPAAAQSLSSSVSQ